MQKIRFFYHDRHPVFKSKTKLKQFVGSIFLMEKRKMENISYIFCSDKHLLGINKEFLDHDYYTDVITFNLGKPTDAIEGEVYLSFDRIKDNAKKMGVSINEELHRVIFHAALHLCGYKDKNKADIKVMRLKEEAYLKKYFS